MLYIPNNKTTKLLMKIIAANVNKLNPIYIGFLLYLYNPDFLKAVVSVGKPNLVDRPRLKRLTMVITNPTKDKK